jgi:hypothetical protein
MENRWQFLLIAVTVVAVLALVTKRREKFQTLPKTLSWNPGLSYQAHQYAFEKMCEARGLKAEKFPHPEQPGIWETKCVVPSLDACAAMNELPSVKGTGVSFKWTTAEVPIVKEITPATPLDIVNGEIKRLMNERATVVRKATKAKIGSIIQQCYSDKVADDANPTDEERKQIIDQCTSENLTELKSLNNEAASEIVKIFLRYALATKDQNIVASSLSPDAKNFSEAANSVPRSVRAEGIIAQAAELGITEAVAYPIPRPQTYVESTQNKNVCVKIPNWMESFCKDSNPCQGGTWTEKDASCTRESGMIKFSIGNLRCYPEGGYCEPKDFKDAFISNCIMTQAYCSKLDTEYEGLEWVYECNGSDCTKPVQRGRCGISDLQFFLENALPIGTTLLRKWKAAGEQMVNECEKSASSDACWRAVGGVLLSTPRMVYDTAQKWYAENFDTIKDAWVAALTNPSLQNIDKFMNSLDNLPIQYVQGKMGEMFDAIVMMIPGMREIWPDGLLKRVMIWKTSTIIKVAQITWTAVKKANFYALQYGPGIIEVLATYGNSAINFFETTAPNTLASIGQDGINWITTQGADFFTQDVSNFFTEDVAGFFTEDVAGFFTEDVAGFFGF